MNNKLKKDKPIVTAQSLGLRRIAIVDESYTHPGFAVWDIRTGALLNFTQFIYEKEWTNKERRIEQMIAVKSLVFCFDCDAVVAEEPRIFPSAQTKARLHEILATIANGILVPLYMVNTTAWKARTVGHNASKAETVNYVLENFHASVDDDVADAICMGEAAYKGIKLTVFD